MSDKISKIKVIIEIADQMRFNKENTKGDKC